MPTTLPEVLPRTDHAVVPTATLYHACKVRAKLDDERIKFIEEQIISNDPALRPILVAETPENPKGRYAIIDGRHRFAAYLKLGYETLPVMVSQEHDPVEWMRIAAAANLEGSPQLPLNVDDINQVVRNFVEAGKSDTWVRSALKGYLTPKAITRAVQWARSNRTKSLIRQAAKYRDQENCSYEKAAAHFDVAADALKDFVLKTKHVGLHKNAELAKELSNLNQTYGSGLSAFFNKVTTAYRDAQIEEEDARGYQQRVSEYKRRIEAQCTLFLQRMDAD